MPECVETIGADNRKIRVSGWRPVSLVWLLFVLIFAGATIFGFRMTRAAALIYSLTNAPRSAPVKVYSRFFADQSTVSEFWIQGRKSRLRIRMLTPKGAPNAPMIILVHGFVREGAQNPVISALAEGLCKSGLRVVVPYIESEQNFRIEPAAVDEIDDVVRWSAKASGEKVSLFGISYSGGMVVSAAANPGYSDLVKMVFCVSGYNSIDRVGRFYLHDGAAGPDGKPYAVVPDAGALTAMAMQYVDDLVPPEDIQPMLAGLHAIAANRRPAVTGGQSAMLDDLVHVNTPEMRARYRAVLDRHHAELAYLSPAGRIQQVHASVYVLHGAVDDIIPSTEAEWTQAEASHQRSVKVIITPWMHHAVLAPYVPPQEKVRVVFFVSQMLDEALNRVPEPVVH
ncbi:MAG TPA: alpha/beta hydrolase [Acidobacteriaceae bacterium]